MKSTQVQLHEQHDQLSREAADRGHTLIDLFFRVTKCKSVNEDDLRELAIRKLMQMTKADLIKTLASDDDLIVLGCSFKSEIKANTRKPQ